MITNSSVYYDFLVFRSFLLVVLSFFVVVAVAVVVVVPL